MDRVPLQDKLRMRESAHWGHDYRGMVEEFGNSRVWKGSLHVGEWSGCGREASMLESGVGVKAV